MTSSFNLKASARQNLGSADSRRVRKAGGIPAILLGENGKNLNIVVDAKDFEHQYFKGNVQTSKAQIELDGKKIVAIAHKIELDPVTDRPVHIDFLPVEKSKQIKAHVKLKFTGHDRSPGLKRGGFLHVVARKVTVLCNADSIPENIEVDISSARVGIRIRNEDLQLPSGVNLVKKGSTLIASMLGRASKEDEEKAATAEGAAPASAPATGAKAPAAKAGDKKEAAKPAAKPAAKK